MKSFSKLIKPAFYTSLGIGATAGAYYLYTNYQKNIMQIPVQTLKQPQKNLTQIPTILTVSTQNAENINQSKQDRIQQKVQKQIIPQSQQSRNQKALQIIVNQQPIPQQKQASKQETKNNQTQQKTKILPQQQIMTISNLKKTLKTISQFPNLPVAKDNNGKSQHKSIVLVPDIGYTEAFQQKIINTIKGLQRLPNSSDIVIYKINTADSAVRQMIQKQYGAKLKDQTIFLIKNQYQDHFVNVQFDMFMQYPTIINTYFNKNKIYNLQNKSQYLKKIEKMSPNQSYLLYVYDDSQPQQKKNERFLTSKYLQMQLTLHRMQHGIKVIPIQAKLAKQIKIIPQNQIRTNSIHILRKHNQFTHANPNLYLNFNNQLKPYHLLADVGFNTKKGNIAIPSYLQKIQTFSSFSIPYPFILSLTIDKNRISTENYNKLMKTFKQIKRKNKYPQIGLTLKFTQVEYLGKDQPQNNQFCIKMANIAELQNQSSMHQIQKIQDARNLGITQKNWLKQSYEYLYPHQVVSEDLLLNFIEAVIHNQIPEYFRSDKPSSLQNSHKIVASNFNKQILDNKLDHFVFQYSQHCPSCKMISPMIGYLNEVLDHIPLEQRFDIHVMNSQKNKVKGQVYSPYTPNMNYFKNQWKHKGPVRIGLQTLSRGGIAGLFDFCAITHSLKTIDSQKFNEAIQNAKKWDPKQFIL